MPCLKSAGCCPTSDHCRHVLVSRVQKARGNEQLKRSSWSWWLIAWAGDEIACNRRQKRTFASLKKSKVQIKSNLLQPENKVLKTEIYSKWKKLFCIDVNSYVIEFLWGHNWLNVCSFPGTILYLPKWSVEKAEWPALPGCASGLIIALFVGIFLLCPMLRTASFPNNHCHYWPSPGYFKELCCWWSLLCERELHPCLGSQAQQWLCRWDCEYQVLPGGCPPMHPRSLIIVGCRRAPWALSTLFLGLDGLKNV